MSNSGEIKPIDPYDIIRHFWNRRWVLLIGAVAAALLTIIFVQGFVGYQFAANAMLMVRQPASNVRPGPALAELGPPVYEEILLNDELLFDVIEQTREEFPDFAQGNWEKVRGIFSVGTVTTQETNVQTEYSPVLKLTTKWNKREIAKFLIDRWLHLIQERYGKLRAREAKTMRQSARKLIDGLQPEQSELLQQRASQQQRLEQVTTLIKAKERILTGTEEKEGLMARLVDLRIQSAINPEGSALPQISEAEEQLQRLQDELKQLRGEKQTLQVSLEELRGELNTLRSELSSARRLYEALSPDYVAMPDPLHPDEISGDLILLSEPVPPEANVGTSKGMFAGIVFFVLLLLLIVFVLIELFTRRALGTA